MWCFTVNAFKQPDEMKFRKVCFISDIAQVNVIRIVGINKKLSLNYPPV